MKLSIQLYTVRKELDADLGGTLQQLADLGLQYVEPYNFAATADALGAALRETGSRPPRVTLPCSRATRTKSSRQRRSWASLR